MKTTYSVITPVHPSTLGYDDFSDRKFSSRSDVATEITSCLWSMVRTW